VQAKESNRQSAGIELSSIVYVWKLVMFPKRIVFAPVPSSTSEKSLRGDGEALKANAVLLFGLASFTTVMEPA
jgi:hypothetical protein